MIIPSDALNKLQAIEIITIRANESHILENLVAKYGKSLKKLTFRLIDLSLEDLKTFFAHISCFECLESLQFQNVIRTKFVAIDDCLQTLAKNCTKLKKFVFYPFFSETSNRLLLALSEFRSLERLLINFDYKTQKLEGSVECLNPVTRLKHFFIGHSGLTEDFFANIETILPNLQFLKIESPKIFGQSLKSFTESLQSMKSIERVVVNDSKFYYQKNPSESKPRILCRVVVESEDEEPDIN